MKKIILTFVFFVSLLFVTKTTVAQDDNNIMVVTTWTITAPEDGTVSEYDSLTAILNDRVVSKNSKIISRSVVRHLWGSDNRHVVVMTEYANMGDIELAGEEGSKLFKKAFPTEEDRKAFGKKFRKYWNGHHSDEIYSVIAKK